jgi:hypothetical protein
VKNRLCRAENWAEVMLEQSSRTVENSPSSGLYLVSASVARRTRVVPGMIGYFRIIYQDILGKFPLTGVNNTGSGPRGCWSSVRSGQTGRFPSNWLAGEVVVIGLYA